MLKTNISWNWEKSEKESKSLFPVLGVDMEEWEVNVWWNKLGFKSDFILRGCFYAFINLYNYWNLTIHRKFTHSVRESEVHQTLWSLDPKHSNREATGTDTKPSQERKNTHVHRNTQRCRLSSGGNSATNDTSLDISCSDRFDYQTVCWGKEFICERLIQAKPWVRLTYLILSSLIFCEWMVLLTQIHSTPQLLIIT